jgi:hypothetical protein
MMIDLELILAGGCRRCGKPFETGDTVSIRHQYPKGRPKLFLQDGDIIFSLSAYHARCVPPIWWHRDQVAGSFPASEVPPESVPQS